MSGLSANRNYRRLWLSSAVSNLGDGVSALAFPWLATLITRDPVLIAAVAVAARLPWFLIALPAGVWTDRADRQRLMVRADTARALLTLGIVALIWAAGDLPPERPALWIAGLAGLALALGTAEVLRDNAAQTALPSVVAKPDFERANGQIWTVEQVMGQFVGPPLAGLLIALAVTAPFLLDAASFALAAVLVAGMRFPARVAPARRSFREEMREGWRWMMRAPVILRLAVMLGGLNAAGYATLSMTPLFVQEVLGLGATGLGLLMTAGAAGGVAGGLIGPAVVARIGSERSLFVALAVFPLGNAAIALAPHWAAVAVAMFCIMAAGVLWNVVTVSYRQRVIPDALLGRVNAIYRFFGWGMMPLGAVLAGLLVSGLGEVLGREAALRGVFWMAAGLSLALWLYGRARLRLG